MSPGPSGAPDTAAAPDAPDATGTTGTGGAAEPSEQAGRTPGVADNYASPELVEVGRFGELTLGVGEDDPEAFLGMDD
ncbi:lasso RiPP family leader peptide-containing protein [Streptomyces sp. NPDC053048]|uniref:lasso RiPP family leader peptide-containing protein n=1 Tax=Streptomyces sp. NPDC053048 TaxID=3365694 RepID=UPI0037CCD5FB